MFASNWPSGLRLCNACRPWGHDGPNRPRQTMSNTQTRWILAGSLLTELAGCEITKVNCNKTPDADICQDDEDIDAGDLFDDDAGDSGSMDGGAKADGSTDAGKDGSTASDASRDTGTDASGDGAQIDASSMPLTIDEFCVAQLSTAVAWRDALETLCDKASVDARDTFLQEVLAYAKDDAEGKCITARKAAVDSGNTTFDGSNAPACAGAFIKGFELPPDPFPTDGIDLAKYRSTIAHGAPTLVQIPACRAAFKGKLARSKPCTDHFECVDGLRCLDAPGGTKTCETALVGGTCAQSSQCADGYTCVGSSAGGGRTCVQNDMLPLMGGNCSFALECGDGLDCNASNKCANPVAEVICKP